METNNRRKFSREFKVEAVKLITEQHYTGNKLESLAKDRKGQHSIRTNHQPTHNGTVRTWHGRTGA